MTETASAEKKRALRTKYRAIRKEMRAEERARVDRLITQRLEALPEWEKADLVLAYLSFGAEVDTGSSRPPGRRASGWPSRTVFPGRARWPGTG